MDKEEFRIKLEEINHLVEQKDYKGAMNVVDSIDWRRVKNVRTLCVVGEIYAANKRFEDSKEIFLLAYHRAPIGKNILYRLIEISLKMGDVDEATEFYDEYREVAPNDNTCLILQYKILKEKNAPINEQIKILEEYKEREFTEKWSYELAKLYYQAGDKQKSLDLCNEIILWFSEGSYVMRALDLKMRMGALTGADRAKYEEKFVPKLLKPEEAQELKEQGKLSDGTEKLSEENEGPEIESITIKSDRDLSGVESLQERISKGIRDIFGSRRDIEGEEDQDRRAGKENVEVQEEMIKTLSSENEFENVPELEPEDAKAEAAASEETELTEEAPVEEIPAEAEAVEIKMPTLTIPESMKNLDKAVEVEVPKAPLQNNLYTNEEPKDPAAEMLGDNFNLEDTILAAASAQGIEIPEEQKAEQTEEAAGEQEEIPAEESVEVQPEDVDENTVQEVEPEPQVVKLEEEEFLSEEDLRQAEEEFLHGPAGRQQETEDVPRLEEEEIPEENYDVEDESVAEVEEAEPVLEEEDFLADEESEDGEEIYEDEESDDKEDACEDEGSDDEADDREDEESEGEEEFYGDEESDEEDDFFEDEEFDDEDDSYEDEEFDDEDDSYEDEESDEEDDFFENEESDEEDDFYEDEEFEDEDDSYEDEEFEDEDDSYEDEEFDDEDDSYEDEEFYEDEEQEEEVPLSEEEELEQFIDSMERGNRDPREIIPRSEDLTDDEKKLFTYFVKVPGMKEQLVEALESAQEAAVDKTSRTGNIMIMGGRGTGKTRLIASLIPAICQELNMKASRVAYVFADQINGKDVASMISKLAGGFLVIEDANQLTAETVDMLDKAMEFRTDGLIVILEDEKIGMRKLIARFPKFAKKFTAMVNIPVFTNDELVNFARVYTKENGFKIDQMGMLALYNLIGMNQKEDEPMNISSVKSLLDTAMAKSQGGLLKFNKKKRVDRDGFIVLHEKDFTK